MAVLQKKKVNTNIKPLLSELFFGAEATIFPSLSQLFTNRDLERFLGFVADRPGATLNGVELALIDPKDQLYFQIPRKVLRINNEVFKLSKEIFEVILRPADGYLVAKKIWPRNDLGREFSFKLGTQFTNFILLEWKGDLPEESSEPSIYSKVRQVSYQMNVLKLFWLISRGEEGKPFNYTFQSVYGDIYSHEDILEKLNSCLQGKELNSIWIQIENLMSSLMRKLQQDILAKLYEDLSILEKLFNSRNGIPYVKALQVIFDERLGPLPKIEENFSNFSQVELNIVIKIINDEKRHPGVRKAATFIYQRVTGEFLDEAIA